MTSVQTTATTTTGRRLGSGPAARPPQDGSIFFRKLYRGLRPYIFLAPFLFTFFAFTVVPLIYAIYISLFRTELIGGTKFVGFSNYVSVFQNSQFWNGVIRMLIFGVVQVPVMLILALVLAMIFDLGLVHRPGPFYRVLYFIPYAIPGVISAFMWGYLYDPALSPFDSILHTLGAGNPNVVSSSLVLPAIGNIVTWEFVGYNMIILFVTLKAIPAELNDAALVDGARLWDLVRRIRLPLIRNGIIFTTVLSIIGTLQIFTEPYILSAFSPAINSYYTPNILIFNTAFTQQNFNDAAAMSLVIGAITILGTIIFLVISNIRRSSV